MATSLPSIIKPIAIPETGAVIGTPASIKARDDPQTEAIDVDQFELITSETTLIAYGKSSTLGRTGINAFSASAP